MFMEGLFEPEHIHVTPSLRFYNCKLKTLVRADTSVVLTVLGTIPNTSSANSSHPYRIDMT